MILSYGTPTCLLQTVYRNDMAPWISCLCEPRQGKVEQSVCLQSTFSGSTHWVDVIAALIPYAALSVAHHRAMRAVVSVEQVAHASRPHEQDVRIQNLSPANQGNSPSRCPPFQLQLITKAT